MLYLTRYRQGQLIFKNILHILLVLILVIGAVMWKQRKDAAKENIEKFEAGSEEWEKKLHSSESDSQFGMSGTYVDFLCIMLYLIYF